MKVKFYFEESDFKGSGQIITREKQNCDISRFEGGSTTTYKVGYVYLSEKKSESYPCLISFADGMITYFDTMGDLLNYINEDPIGYRPVSKEELVAIVSTEGNRFA